MSQEKQTNFNLIPNEVHIWKSNIHDYKDNFEYLYQLLSDKEKERANRFYFEKDKKSFTVSKAFLRILLGKYLNLQPQEITFFHNEYGKPYVQTEQKLEFNVSHSKDFAVYAFCLNKKIGVDIEFMREKVSFKQIIHRFFSPYEIKDFLDNPEEKQKEAFFNGWSRKEAYIKAKGKGLAIELDSFDVVLKVGSKAELVEMRDEASTGTWKLEEFFIHKDYKSAFVIEENYFQYKIFDTLDI